MRIVALSGGVGGARFLRGLVRATDPDGILYALAGVADDQRGWGRADETWIAFEEAVRLGGESWFMLGDRDLGLHLVRTQALAEGEPLSAVTARLASALGVEAALLPATNDRLRTWIDTPDGSFSFQEWFVARRHADDVDRVRFEGEDDATPAPGVVEAIEQAELIVICPSNPFISIWPILAVDEIRAAVERRRVPSVAVSPLIGGRAIKGPADRMLERLAGGTDPVRVATCYQGVIDVLVFDESEAEGAAGVEGEGVRAVAAPILMRDEAATVALAETVLACA